MSEYDEQLTVFEYCHGYGGNVDERLKMLHVIENTKGSGRPAAGAKESAGVPDMFLAIVIPPFHGLYIELKKKGGKVSPSQRDWIKRLRSHGYAAEVCYGADMAIATLQQYLSGEVIPF